MATIDLLTAEAWRSNWYQLTAEQIDVFVKSGDLSMDFEAAMNQSVVYRKYAGTVSLRVIYRAFGEVVNPVFKGWHTFNVKPETAYLVTGLILQQEPTVLEALVRLNGGVMPDIKEPLIEPTPVEAAPAVEPAPYAPPVPEAQPVAEPQPAPDNQSVEAVPVVEPTPEATPVVEPAPETAPVAEPQPAVDNQTTPEAPIP